MIVRLSNFTMHSRCDVENQGSVCRHLCSIIGEVVLLCSSASRVTGGIPAIT